MLNPSVPWRPPLQECAPLTGGEAVAAGVPLQLLLAVLTVKVILAGRAQVHWHGEHTMGIEEDCHARQGPGPLVTSGCLRLRATSQSGQEAELGLTSSGPITRRKNLCVRGGTKGVPCQTWGLMSHLDPGGPAQPQLVKLNRVKQHPRGPPEGGASQSRADPTR